jgi:hypothetical protein
MHGLSGQVQGKGQILIQSPQELAFNISLSVEFLRCFSPPPPPYFLVIAHFTVNAV